TEEIGASSHAFPACCPTLSVSSPTLVLCSSCTSMATDAKEHAGLDAATPKADSNAAPACRRILLAGPCIVGQCPTSRQLDLSPISFSQRGGHAAGMLRSVLGDKSS